MSLAVPGEIICTGISRCAPGCRVCGGWRVGGPVHIPQVGEFYFLVSASMICVAIAQMP